MVVSKDVGSPKTLPKFLKGSKQLFMNGKWMDGSGKACDTFNPATGEMLCQVSTADKKDIDQAVKYARATFDTTWWKVTPYERERWLHEIADCCEKYAEEFCQIECYNSGVPIQTMRNIVMPWVVRHFRNCANWASRGCGEPLCTQPNHAFGCTWCEPAGVVGCATAYTNCFVQSMWHIGWSIACGNCCIMTPAVENCLGVLRFCDMLTETSLPKGVVQVCCGPMATAGSLGCHTGVNRMVCMGDQNWCNDFAKACNGYTQKCYFMPWNHCAQIVCADANLEAAAINCAMSIFTSRNMMGVPMNWIWVQKSCYEDFVERFCKTAKSLKCGSPLQTDTDLGPMNNEHWMNWMMQMTETCKKAGGTVKMGGKRPSEPHMKKGWYFEPTVITDADWKCMNDVGMWGPMACISPFKDFNDAMFNPTNWPEWMTGACVWTKDVQRAHWMARCMRVKNMCVNSCMDLDGFGPGCTTWANGSHMGHQMYTQSKTLWVSMTGTSDANGSKNMPGMPSWGLS